MNRLKATNSVAFASRDTAPVSGTPQYATDGNPATSTPATIWPAYMFNMMQDEMMALVTAAGLTPDDTSTNWTQLFQSLFLADALIDTSVSANTLTFAPPVTIPAAAVKRGFRFWGQVANTNTSQTVNATISGGSSIPIVDARGILPQIGDLRSGRFYLFIHDGTSLRVAAGLSPDPTPASGPTLYVRSDGSDSNNGSANDAAHAFLTIPAAINYALQRFVLGGKTLTIQLGVANTYNAPTSIPVGIGAIAIRGDTANQDNYVIQGNGSGNSAVIMATGVNLTLSGVAVSNTGTATNWLGAAYGGVINLDHVTITGVSGNPFSMCDAFPDGGFSLGVGIKITSNCGNVFFASGGGSVSCQVGCTITLSGGPAISGAFARATVGGTISCSGTTITGSATGTRYNADLNGVITTFGGGASFFPGSVAGTTATGGQYA